MTSLLLRTELPRMRKGLYVEQPYASWLGLSRAAWSLRASRSALRPESPASLTGLVPAPLEWLRYRGTASVWNLKRRAALRYRSQLPRLHRLPLSRIGLYELLRGGEGIAWLDS